MSDTRAHRDHEKLLSTKRQLSGSIFRLVKTNQKSGQQYEELEKLYQKMELVCQEIDLIEYEVAVQ